MVDWMVGVRKDFEVGVTPMQKWRRTDASITKGVPKEGGPMRRRRSEKIQNGHRRQTVPKRMEEERVQRKPNGRSV